MSDRRLRATEAEAEDIRARARALGDIVAAVRLLVRDFRADPHAYRGSEHLLDPLAEAIDAYDKP